MAIKEKYLTDLITLTRNLLVDPESEKFEYSDIRLIDKDENAYNHFSMHIGKYDFRVSYGIIDGEFEFFISCKDENSRVINVGSLTSFIDYEEDNKMNINNMSEKDKLEERLYLQLNFICEDYILS